MKEFRAHSVILRARSTYFKGALSNYWITKENDMIKFFKPNVTPIVFDMILKYIYTGELNLNKQSSEDILKLLVASDELLIDELFEYVQNYLIERRNSWIRQNFVHVLHTVSKFIRCKKLQNYCLETICEEPEPFITSKNFLSLEKDILYSLLERDDLQIKEIDVWDYLVKWGIEQTPGLGSGNSDRTKWNNENYESLKKTLCQFIPLIRFIELSNTDFIDKVQPYKDIIPNHIYEEVKNFYYKNTLPKTITLPSRIGKFESKIIKPKLANIIVNWINNKKSRTINDSYYKFKLVYRGSRDGMNSNSFRNRCSGRVASLVLIRVQPSGKIFGGYSSIGLSSIGDNYSIGEYGFKFYEASDNFIFSFENSKDTQNMKISRVVNHSKAILDYTAGFNFGRSSLCMSDQNLYLSNYYGNYENNLNTNTIYNIEEIETFIVSKQ
ncbi:hypothetical protein GLOIN_2v1834833 [Rhizophagus irregularis DAOM 181602=DAOM 197198]|nr:hypothetical protein GLOIN_2v1834833 [Rhizophagus irregularis DAOM 181602=DAOM 197198]